MKQLGGRVIRIHLQFGKIMQTIDDPNRESVDRVKNLLRLAERHELYLNLTGLGCYHKRTSPNGTTNSMKKVDGRLKPIFGKSSPRPARIAPAVLLRLDE